VKNEELLQGVRELIADAHAMSDEADRREAAGWLVVTVDDEDGKVIHAHGDFDTPEQALVYAAKLDAECARQIGGTDEPGWTNTVAPRFVPT